MDGNGYYINTKLPGIIKDDRFADSWKVFDGYMVLSMTAYYYLLENLTDEFINGSSTYNVNALKTNDYY